MKTRSNMPLFVVETDNVKALSNYQIDLLRCGDYLVKKDASGEHAYKVTYKSETGMCLTYMDASVIETQSYDKVDGNWVYNSEDKSGNLIEDVKPIYWHSVTLKRIASGELKFYMDFIILNNDETPLTMASLQQWLVAHPTAKVKIVQGYESTHATDLVSYFDLNPENSQQILIHTINLTTGEESAPNWTLASGLGITLTDAVNKIN